MALQFAPLGTAAGGPGTPPGSNPGNAQPANYVLSSEFDADERAISVGARILAAAVLLSF